MLSKNFNNGYISITPGFLIKPYTQNIRKFTILIDNFSVRQIGNKKTGFVTPSLVKLKAQSGLFKAQT